MAKFKVKSSDYQLIVKVRLSLSEKVNERQLDFFMSKNVRGLLKAKLKRKNLVEYIGPIGISLYDRMQKPVGKYDFLFIMEQIVDIVQRLNKNSLIVNNIVFDTQAVFINEVTRELQFIYLPLDDVQQCTNVMDLIEQIIYAAKPLTEPDMEYVSRFVYYIKSLHRFDAEKIEKYILGEDASIVNIIKRHGEGTSGFITNKPADYYAHYATKDDEETELLNDNTTCLLDGNEATGLLNEEETGLLNEKVYAVRQAGLLRVATGENILVNKPVFRIGKEQNYSDYFVVGNDKVSRRHANIVTRGNRFYFTDLGSKNGSYINGQLVPAGQETEIYDGDNICLANEEFVINL